MDQAWIRRKEQELETRFQREQDRICKGIEEINHLPASCRESLIKEIRSLKRTDQKLTWDAETATVTTYRNPGWCLMDLMAFLDEEGPDIYVLRDYIQAMGDPVLELAGTVTRIQFPKLGIRFPKLR